MSTTEIVRVRLSNVYPYIRERRAFDANGTLRGIVGATEGMGRLPEHYHSRFLTAAIADDLYMVYSYRTPIAWFANGEWTIPSVKYSVTTARHLSAIRKGL
jgi:hypothetical protein